MTSSTDSDAPSHLRLPFHHLIVGDPLKILSGELSLQTISKLLPFAKLLALPPDYLHVQLIETVLSANENEKLKAGVGAVDSRCTMPSFGELQPVLARLSNLQDAVIMAKNISDHYPLGDDKVHALQEAVRLAQAVMVSANPNTSEMAKKTFDKLTDLIKRVTTEDQLNKAGFYTPPLRELIATPKELVCKLYEEFACIPGETSVHVVATAIMDRYTFSSEKVTRFLIQKWLKIPDGVEGVEETGGRAGNKRGGGLTLSGVFDEVSSGPTVESSSGGVALLSGNKN